MEYSNNCWYIKESRLNELHSFTDTLKWEARLLPILRIMFCFIGINSQRWLNTVVGYLIDSEHVASSGMLYVEAEFDHCHADFARGEGIAHTPSVE